MSSVFLQLNVCTNEITCSEYEKFMERRHISGAHTSRTSHTEEDKVKHAESHIMKSWLYNPEHYCYFN